MSNLNVKYQKALDAADAFEGMMMPISIALFAAFLEYQNQHSINGDMIEFGVYKGRSAAVLLEHLRKKETAILVDVADYPELDKLSNISTQYKFIKGKSEELVQTSDFQNETDRPFRFSHHDASHSFKNVADEMLFMQDRLAPRGIMVLDDFVNPCFFQVVGACFTHLTKPDNKLKFLLNSSNKAYLCREEDFPFYEDFVANHLLEMISGLGYNYYLARTEKSAEYAGFSLYPKTRPDQPNLYGVQTYGMQYYKVDSAE